MLNSDLIENIFNGDPRAIARAITRVESGAADAAELMKAVFPRTGKAVVIGITGSPGAGKSSLVDKLALHYKNAGEKIGIICIDPSSPFSGGAILGDRIRMNALCPDQTFVRSLATRGSRSEIATCLPDAIAA